MEHPGQRRLHPGNIVMKENDQLLDVLNTTHQINIDIGQRLQISQQTKLEIAKMFDLYRGVAERG